MLKGKIHSIETFGTVDGPGIRYVIFFQGCPLRCQYCHNRDTWNINGGREVTIEELIDDIKKYLPFIESSGGGVTISGGEPTLQMPFLLDLLKNLKKLKIHTAIDTSGFTPIDKITEALQYIDLILLDIKHIDKIKHQNLTGVSNENTLSLARYLSNHNKEMWIRHVVVPEITDHPEDIRKMAQFLKTLKTVTRIELLPYHIMGKHKWDLLGKPYPLEGIREANTEDLDKVKEIFKQEGVEI